VMRYMAKREPTRMGLLSQAMGGSPANLVQELIASLGLPQHIANFGIGEPELRQAADQLAGKHATEDIFGIYYSALDAKP